jgi:predicted dehydrogenase
MSDTKEATISRRDFLKDTGRVTAASALTLAGAIPAVHAQGTSLINVAFVGCGGRGTGAAKNALMTNKQGPIKILAMADAFPDRLKNSYENLSKDAEVGKMVDVSDERKFTGWEAYKHAMDCLRPGDVVILTTPLAFRWVHYTYAIQKGLNVFMEKPLTADGPTSRRMLQLARDASAKNLKCGVGLMSRHAKPLQELHERIQNGEMGDIVLMRGYRMQGAIGHCLSVPRAQFKPPVPTDLEYQVRRFHSFLWAGGGAFSDYNIHIIDHLSWMKNAWPVKAQAVGGRQYKANKEGVPYVDQNFDSYSVEYTFPDGTKMYFDGRTIDGCAEIYSSHIHGSKGYAIGSRAGDCPPFGGPSAIYKGQNADSPVAWQSTDRTNPYQNEWDALISAIRNNKPHNEVKRGVEASLVTSMGRYAAHTGQEVTFDEFLNHEHEYAPGIDKWTNDNTTPPVVPDAQGFYPRPEPGVKTKREY